MIIHGKRANFTGLVLGLLFQLPAALSRLNRPRGPPAPEDFSYFLKPGGGGGPAGCAAPADVCMKALLGAASQMSK